MKTTDRNRIAYLDGLRGIAILMVMLFHAYAKWPDVVPYGHLIKGSHNIFQYGWVGVQLFFLISGYVILMTLEKCKNSFEFLYRRWIRLFPAMAICTVLIGMSSFILTRRPAGIPSPINFIPGLLFIEPAWCSKISGVEIKSLEDSFWSLYVEFKFYIISCFLFYFFGRGKMIFSLFLLFLLTVFVRPLDTLSGPAGIMRWGLLQLSFDHFGWFCAGSGFYIYHQTKQKFWLMMSLGMIAICASIFRGMDYKATIAASCVSAFFILPGVFPKIQSIVGHSVLIWFGFISYPLYLIHENAMISLVVQLGAGLPDYITLFLPVFALIIFSTLAYLISKYGEPMVKNKINNLFVPVRA